MTLVTPPSGPDFDVTDYEALAYYRREPGYVVHDGVSGPASTAPTLPAWAASTSYKAGQEVWISAGVAAIAQTTHVSGSTYATDKAAGKWIEVGSGTYAPISAGRPGNLAVFLGDSETLGSDDPVNQSAGDCWPVYLSLITGSQVQYVRNAGVFGNTTASMLARFDTDVTPYAPNVVTFMGGTNDTGNGVPLATFQANVIAIIAKIRAIGAVPVLFTMPPNNGVAPTNRKQQVVQFNAWIRRYAAQQGIALVDAYAAVVDPTNGNFQAAYNSGDGTHWSAAGQLAVAKAAQTALAPFLPPFVPPLVADDNNENNLIVNGTFASATGTALPSPWTDGAGTPAGSAISFTTDAAVPGKLLTITSTATAALRQITHAHNLGATTMPAVAANATTFSLSVNPFSRGVLFIGSGSTFEIVKVLSVSGSGPYTVNLARGLTYAHSAGEPVIINGQPGDVMAFSGLVTTDAGVTTKCGVSVSGGTPSIAPMANLTQPLTRAVWYREFVIPASSTQLTSYVQLGPGTGVTSFGRLGLLNLTRMAV